MLAQQHGIWDSQIYTIANLVPYTKCTAEKLYFTAVDQSARYYTFSLVCSENNEIQC